MGPADGCRICSLDLLFAHVIAIMIMARVYGWEHWARAVLAGAPLVEHGQRRGVLYRISVMGGEVVKIVYHKPARGTIDDTKDIDGNEDD
jgi:hypothetical protein